MRSGQFSEADRQHVAQAIRDAESKTSAEIVPVIAHSSGRYDRPEDIVGLWLALVGIVVVWYFYPSSQVKAGSWDTSEPVWELVSLVAVTIIGFVVGAVLATRIGWLRRLFTPAKQMREEVFGRARQVFFDNRVYRTAGSLRRAALHPRCTSGWRPSLPTRSVIDKLGQAQIDQTCAEFTPQAPFRAEARRGTVRDGPIPRPTFERRPSARRRRRERIVRRAGRARLNCARSGPHHDLRRVGSRFW